MKKRSIFLRGLHDGLPIGLGYFAVAVALGVQASGAGITAFEAALMSAVNMTSAGEAAAVTMLGLGTTYIELMFTQLVINARYLLMSCALSQKLAPRTSVLHRLLVGYCITDEIFAVEMSQEGKLSPFYSYGVMAMAIPGWTLGTLLGVLLGNLLPARVVSALGVALYAMFLAAILPATRKSRVIAGVVVASMLASAVLTFVVDHFLLTWLTEGFRIILLTVVISLAAALLFPVKDEEVQHEG